MERIEFAGWTVECDVEATRAAHAVPAGAGGPEPCTCLHCRNFAAARAAVYPAAALALFARLGIDPGREAEVYHLGPDGAEREGPTEARTHHYGGWFHVVGRIVDRTTPDAAGPWVDLGDGFALTFVEGEACESASFAGRELFRVEIVAHVPWVLAEPYAE